MSRVARHLRLSVLLALTPVLALVLSCDAIDLPAPGCGNQLIEPDLGEACDASEPAAHCGAPGSPNACQPLCGEEIACPDHYVCGGDGVCRTPSLTFSAGESPNFGGARQVVAADFERDGRAELVTLDQDLRLSRFDAQRRLASTTRTDGRVLEGADYAMATDVAFVSGTTLLLRVGHGFQLLRAEDDNLTGLFVPELIGLTEDARILPGGRFLLSEGALRTLTRWPVDEVFPLDVPLDELSAEPAVLNTASCSFALLPTQHTVVVQALDDLCTASSATLALADASDSIVRVDVARFDDDALDDLLITAETALQPEVFVAYGWADGTFRSGPPADGAAIEGQASSEPVFPAYLALGDIDGNGFVDAVTAKHRVFFGGGACDDGVPPNPCIPPMNGPFSPEVCFTKSRCVELDLLADEPPSFSQAALVDLDHSGKLDLLAVETGSASLSFYADPQRALEVAYLPQSVAVPAGDEVAQLVGCRVGGDTVDDYAMLAGSQVSLGLGNAFAPPSGGVPISAPPVNQLARIELLVSAFHDPWAFELLGASNEGPTSQTMAAYSPRGWPAIQIATVDPKGMGLSGLTFLDVRSTTVLSEGTGLDRNGWGVVVTSPHEVQLFPNRAYAVLTGDFFSTTHADNRPTLDVTERIDTLDPWLVVPFDVDHDKDRIDELVLLGPGADSGTGQLQVLRPVIQADVAPDQLAWAGELETLPFPLGVRNGDSVRPGRVVGLDADADGVPDVLFALSDETPARLVAITPRLDAPSEARVEPLPFEPSLLTTLSLGPAEPAALVVVATTGELGVFRFVGPEGAPNPCFAEPSAEPRRLVRCGTSVASFPQFGNDVRSVTSGDFDGDGIADLAASSDTTLWVQYGGHLLQSPAARNSTAD